MNQKSRYRKTGAPRSKRPPKHADDDANTRQRILDAARPLFAEHGFAGTSIRDIVSAAGVNLSAVSYHFVTKDLLYVGLLQAIVGPLAPRIEWCTRGDIPPLMKLEKAVRAIFDHLRANPDMPAYMVRELANGRPPSPPLLQIMGRIVPALASIIVEGQAQGVIRAGDPVLFVFSTIAQPVHLYLARGAIGAVTGLDVNDPEVHNRFADHAVAVVRAALEQR